MITFCRLETNELYIICYVVDDGITQDFDEFEVSFNFLSKVEELLSRKIFLLLSS